MRIPFGDEITILDENQKKRREAARGHIYMLHTRSHFLYPCLVFSGRKNIYDSYDPDEV